MLCSPSSMAHLANRPEFSGFSSTLLIGWSVTTCIGCAWKYLRSLLAVWTRARASFSKGGYLVSANFRVLLKK
ncbi:hypothetical protein HanRHA438_Chr16g0744401 [Helianthus annuus]|nr:hypothetical protein HanRHA438_Chr16g0744401 [Helianthus annuus]